MSRGRGRDDVVGAGHKVLSNRETVSDLSTARASSVELEARVVVYVLLGIKSLWPDRAPNTRTHAARGVTDRPH